MLNEAIQGTMMAKVLFVIIVPMVWLPAVLTLGYPAIIMPALTAVPAMFVVRILITKG